MLIPLSHLSPSRSRLVPVLGVFRSHPVQGLQRSALWQTSGATGHLISPHTTPLRTYCPSPTSVRAKQTPLNQNLQDLATTNSPSQSQPRNIVLCLDGTNERFDDDVTNIVKLYGLLDKSDTQLTYYQPGLGTYASPGFWMDRAGKFRCLMDSAFARYLDAHVLGAYKFLMNQHRQGDKIFIFGFSRGAYAARCLAGMLHKVGLLAQGNEEQLRFAYRAYINTTEAGIARSERFKKTFSKVVDINFLGCWDTVQSVGEVYSRDLPFSGSNRIVKVFRHALALDERRGRYTPTLWHRKSLNPYNDPNNPYQLAYQSNPSFQDIKPKDSEEYGKRKTDVQEVWFAGCHSDVGGGSIDTVKTKPSLSRLSLRWMVNHAVSNGLVLKLNEEGLDVLGLNPKGLPRRTQEGESIGNKTTLQSDHPLVKGRAWTDRALSLTESAIRALRKIYDLENRSDKELMQLLANTEAKSEALDADGNIHDKLLQSLWCLLELIPFQYRYQDGNGKFYEKLMLNWGNYRKIFIRNPNSSDYHPPKLHASVAERDSYTIKAKFVYQEDWRQIQPRRLKVLLIQDDPKALPIPAEVVDGRVYRL